MKEGRKMKNERKNESEFKEDQEVRKKISKRKNVWELTEKKEKGKMQSPSLNCNQPAALR